MFNFLYGCGATTNPDAARNAYQPQPQPLGILDTMSKEIQDIQKIVDALCKVYVADNAKEIADRPYATQFYVTDQPIIDRAKLLELQHKIMVAEMELKELKRSTRI